MASATTTARVVCYPYAVLYAVRSGIGRSAWSASPSASACSSALPAPATSARSRQSEAESGVKYIEKRRNRIANASKPLPGWQLPLQVTWMAPTHCFYAGGSLPLGACLQSVYAQADRGGTDSPCSGCAEVWEAGTLGLGLTPGRECPRAALPVVRFCFCSWPFGADRGTYGCPGGLAVDASV